jgi:LysM repeat protein
MGFLDNVRDALKEALSTHTSKAAKAGSDDRVADTAGTIAAVDPTPEPTPEPEPESEPDAREARWETYTVKSGDTLSEIGARFGVSKEEIAKLNGIENPDLIFPGQVFRIPTS